MAPKLTQGTANDGVIVWQDDSVNEQFHYLPARATLVLGETLDNFSVNYWGINENPYFVDFGGGDFVSSVGGTFAGQARIDISAQQRANIVDTIGREFGVENPKLLPLDMTDITVQPVFARNLVEMSPDSSVTFPEQLQLGQSFAYNISAKNSLFATLAAGVSSSATPTTRADFAVNVTGMVEYVGDPWVAQISCDLSKVWSYVRSHVSASATFAWFELGSAEYENIVQEMTAKQIIKVDFKEGTGPSTRGPEMLDAARTLFDALNAQAVAGEGFFRFEPNPTPQGNTEDEGGGWFPFRVSINGSYSSTTFKQSIEFSQEIRYTGRVKVLRGAVMALGVSCGPGTSQFFSDFQDVNERCLTQAKLDGLQSRLEKEADAKQKKLNKYLRKYENGEWDEAKFKQMMALLRTISLTEWALFDSDPVNDRFLTFGTSDEAAAKLDILEELENDTIRLAMYAQPDSSSDKLVKALTS